jgi:hypothetical protein
VFWDPGFDQIGNVSPAPPDCGWRSHSDKRRHPSRRSFATIFSGFRLFLDISNSPSAVKAILQGGSLGVIAGRTSCIEIGSSQTDRVENQSSLRNRRENAMSNHAESMSRRKANCGADEADRIVAERKISSCPDVIVP